MLSTDLICLFFFFSLYSFHITTWNVSTKSPENLNLNSLLGLEKNPKNDKHLPDFYIIGLQEINSQPQNAILGLFKDDPWIQKFKDILKLRHYFAVKTEQMQGLLIVMFAQRKHLLHLREIETEFTRTGLGGIWVSLFSFCFVDLIDFESKFFLG